MSDGQSSGYRFYGIGVATTDLVRGSWEITVNLSEQNSMTNGDINKKTDSNVSTPDANGVPRKVASKSGRTVPARWLPFCTPNRITPPDIVNGETVMVWKYADVEGGYFWSTMMMEAELRRLEHVVYAYSNLPGGRAAFDENSSYWAKWSTQDKLIHIHTSNNDGEPVAFDIVIDTRNGQIIHQDSLGNNTILDSPSSTFQIKTNNEFLVETESKVTVKTKIVDVTAEQATVTCPETVFTGNVRVGGNLIVGGGISMGASSSRTARAAAAAAEMVIYGNIKQAAGNFESVGTVTGTKGIFPDGVDAPNV